MTKQIITLSDNAAQRIKEIMSNAEKDSLGVRVGVKSGGCAGMSYVMEYTNEANPNELFLKGLYRSDGNIILSQLFLYLFQKSMKV